MWWLELVALRALTDRHRMERIMRAALGGARFRMAPFGIRHLGILED
jgi:hypothetical protein